MAMKLKRNVALFLAGFVACVAGYFVWRNKEPLYEGRGLGWHLEKAYAPNLMFSQSASIKSSADFETTIRQAKRSREVVTAHGPQCMLILTNWLTENPL